MTLTREGFERLLAVLDPDPTRAGERYELLRRKLIRFFEWHRCGPAEDQADQVFDRVGRRLEEGEVIRAANPSSYFYGVARNVLHEYWDQQQREQRNALAGTTSGPPEGPTEAGSDAEDALDCLERCLGKLSPERRSLIVRYYLGEKGSKIRARRGLADQLQLAPNALRLRAFRIRESLERCVRHCLEAHRSQSGSSAPDRNKSPRFSTRLVERKSP
jgi:DNA-directed RNA polymerase specialized sigma24 family protein